MASLTIRLPPGCLVVLVGPSGSGKSSFARAHFAPTEIVSSDACRALVSDDEGDQSASADAFDLVHSIVTKRLARGRLTVVDATNLEQSARAVLLALAGQRATVAIVFDLDPDLCRARDAQRSGRSVGSTVVEEHRRLLGESLGTLHREGFDQVIVLDSAEAVTHAVIERAR